MPDGCRSTRKGVGRRGAEPAALDPLPNPAEPEPNNPVDGCARCRCRGRGRPKSDYDYDNDNDNDNDSDGLCDGLFKTSAVRD
jgi:hypothetical protein